ncbi:hypothetical protein CK203_109353 [Vitis vinifera]|uniref:Uncharacterized protein n=1 Tax=Vitis vinifera TaxID=29760 RepID=A0A438FH87_VITVI|nr:hypothetical protein CK203_109353 [Vitis vinifera]
MNSEKTTESPRVASSGGGEGADMCRGRIPRTEEDIQNRLLLQKEDSSPLFFLASPPQLSSSLFPLENSNSPGFALLTISAETAPFQSHYSAASQKHLSNGQTTSSIYYRYHGITLGCYIGTGTEDRWASDPAIVDSGEHPAQLYYTHLHHRHRGLLYNRIIQFHLRHHPQFSQPHELELLFYMVRLRPCHILLLGGYDDLRVAALPVEFRMLDIESGAAQRWFASLDLSRRRTWVDLGQEFIIHYYFNTVVDVSWRELEALRQRLDEHLMGFPQTDFGLLVQALYGIEEDTSRGLWADSSPSDSKGKKLGSGHRSLDIGAIGVTGHRAAPPPRPARQFTQLGITLSRAFQRFVEGGLITPLPPRPPLQPTLLEFRTDLHCAYHQRVGHDTDSCATLRHAIQNLIDHGDEIFMMEWDREAPQPISLYEDSYFSGYIHGQQVPKPFRLIPDEVPRQIAVSLVCLQYVLPMTPFILFPEEYGPIHRDVQIVTRSGNVA